MKNRRMIGIASLVMAVLVVPMLLPGNARSWDPATHAYIEEQLHKKRGQLDSGVLYNRIYGANVIDMFNNKFTSPYQDFAYYLHDPAQEHFLKAWELADTRAEKAFAYGFVGHNNAWGMDSTAHISGITYGRGEGYVIAKARILAAMLKPVLEEQLGPLPDQVVEDICHYFVESGVDFLVRGMDPSIGSKLIAADVNRSDAVPALLVNAYKADFAALAGIPENEAATIIATAEGMHRLSITSYGWALTQDNALELVAGGMAQVGAEYLASLGFPPIPPEALVPLVEQGIIAAMSLCAPDIDREIRASTGWVNGRLSSHGISW
jgi:hypothetical protein